MTAALCTSTNPSSARPPARLRFSTPALASWAEAQSAQPPDLVAAAFHWLEYLGLLGALGSIAVRRLGRMPPRIPWAEPPAHLALGLAVVGGLGLLVMDPSPLLIGRVAAEGIALVLCLRGIPWVVLFAGAATLMLPFTGHAAAESVPAGAVFTDAVHVLSAAIWSGCILALASIRPPEGWKSDEARMLLDRFGRVALLSFGVTALTGLLRATEQLHEVSQLWSTEYGQVLLLKSAGVLVMLALSLLWRRGRPVAGAEAAAAVLVIAATALLAAFPLPA